MNPQLSSTRLLSCLLLGVLGFAGNWLKLELFFNVDFLGGSFFAMLAILMLGGSYGFIVGFLASTCTYFLWKHPWAIIIMSCEALFVALVHSRRKGNIIIYDVIYWMCIGTPMIYLFYHSLMGVQMQGTLLIMLKQSVNGVFNCLMASLAIMILSLANRSARERIAYSQLIFASMVFLALLPAMGLLIAGVKTHLKNEEKALSARVSATSETARNSLAAWIREHQQSVHTLSTLVGDPDTSSFTEMQHYVETIKSAATVFYRMGVLNKDSITVAYSPLEDEKGQSFLGVDFSDRPYISILRESKRPYIPDVVMGKLGEPTPIVLLLSPIVVAGEYRGYCSGVVATSYLSEILTNIAAGENVQITLVDGDGKVIAGTFPRLKVMEPFQRPYAPGGMPQATDVLHWIPDPQPGTSIMQRWRASLFVRAVAVGHESRWKVIVEAPLLPLVEEISRYSILGLMLLACSILLTVSLSHLFSSSFVSTVIELQELTRSLPNRIDSTGRIPWPDSNIKELAALSDNFQCMAVALGNSFQQQIHLNETLEQKVRDRTKALSREINERRQTEELLRESEEKYRVLFTNELFAICIFDAQTLRFIDINECYVRLYGYSREELLREMTIHDITVEREASDAATRQALSEGTIYIPLRFHKKKDGTVFPVEIVGGPYVWQERRVMFAVARDITERIDQEKEIEEYRKGLQRLVEERTRELAARNEQLRKEIEQRVNVEAALRHGQEELQALAARLSESEEAERGRLALELHDRVGQNLGALNINLNLLKNFLSPASDSRVFERIGDSLALVKETVECIRNIMADLRPPVLDDYGLAAALRWYGDRFKTRTGVETIIRTDRAETPHLLPLSIETAFFRIFQEAMTNVARHAHSTQVKISLTEDEERVSMTIEDNGTGFSPEVMLPRNLHAGWGLMGMRERAQAIGADLKIESEPGKGTQVVVMIGSTFAQT